ncbi:MAG: AMP-binding protein, partial [Pseudomonadales bacterium]|nr:AMP-binding protein [Pseudomonadales bacterium]
MAFERIDTDSQIGLSNIIPIGVGIDGVQILVVNDSLRPVGVSEIGEIVIRTPYLSLGYENDERLTASSFPLLDTYSAVYENTPARIYRTGDLGRYLPDGRVQLIDRCDSQINIRGFRVEPGEIEATLLCHEFIKAIAVKQAAVNGALQLVAYVVFCDSAVSAVNSIDSVKGVVFDWVREKLPEYMLPQSYVVMESIPLTANGKTDYAALLAPGKGDRTSQYLAPRTSIEEQLALIWEEVLGVSPIGVNDSFFELGGHSLLATLVMSRLNAIYQVSIPLRMLFEKLTIAAISIAVEEVLSTGVSNTAPEIKVVSRDQNIPVSFAQNRLWFMQKLDPTSVALNMPFPLLLKGTLDERVLERVFQEMFRRHEVLGANFIEQEGVPYFQFNSLENWTLDKEYIDVTGSSADDIDRLQKRIANTDASKVFNLALDPLVRVRLISFGHEGEEKDGGDQQGEHLLLLTLHHVISDGWSMNLFMREFVALYGTAKHGLPSSLAPLKVQYADYAYWQREWLQGDVLDTQLGYWEKKLAGAPQILRLPTDKPRPTIQTFSGSSYSKKMSFELTRQINAFSQENQLSLFMTLMGTYQVLLSRYTQTNDICVGTPIAGRHHGDTENIIGLFLNGLIVRTEFDDNPSIDAFYARVKDTMLDAYAHQDLPVEMLFERLDYDRNPTYPTGIQVGFQLQNMNNAAASAAGRKGSSQGSALADDLSVCMLQRENVVAKYDMTWILEERDGILEVSVEYNNDLFFESTIANMVVHYEHLLSAVISGEYQSIRALPIANEKTIAREIGLDISSKIGDVLHAEAVYPLTLNQQSIYLSALVDPDTVQNSFGFCTDVPASMDV